MPAGHQFHFASLSRARAQRRPDGAEEDGDRAARETATYPSNPQMVTTDVLASCLVDPRECDIYASNHWLEEVQLLFSDGRSILQEMNAIALLQDRLSWTPSSFIFMRFISGTAREKKGHFPVRTS